MSIIFTFGKQRLVTCQGCGRLLAIDDDVCPHCAFDRSSEIHDMARLENSVEAPVPLLLTDDRPREVPAPRVPRRRRHRVKAVIVAVAIVVVGGLWYLQSREPEERFTPMTAQAALGSVVDKGKQNALAVQQVAQSNALDAQLGLARSCVKVNAWDCVREHAGNALKLDPKNGESQDLLEQAITQAGWKSK
jgi:hypothetical protein